MVARIGLALSPVLLGLSTIVFGQQTSDRPPHAAWEFARTLYPPSTPSIDQRLTDPILDGTIDLHAHFGPDAYPRQWDVFQIAQSMASRGLRGVVFKNHFTESAGVANLVRRHGNAPGFEVFGGLSLNTAVGGINPEAVRYFAAVEGSYAKIVWMPTHDSEHEVTVLGQDRPFVRVSRDGALLPEVLEVLDIVKQEGLVLATGHVTPAEMLMIMEEAHRRGLGPVIVTHPDLGPQFTDATIEELERAIELGGYVEIVASALRGPRREVFIDMIRRLGPEHCFVSSDSGLVGTPNHADALVIAIRTLRAAGFDDAALDLLFRTNPRRLLGLQS
jgi:hypothetical protein